MPSWDQTMILIQAWASSTQVMALTDASHQAVLLLYCHQSSHITDLPFSTTTLWQPACPHKMGCVSLQQQPLSSDKWHDSQQAMGCIFIATILLRADFKTFGWHIYNVHDMAAMWWIWQMVHQTHLFLLLSAEFNLDNWPYSAKSVWRLIHIHTSQLGLNWAAWKWKKFLVLVGAWVRNGLQPSKWAFASLPTH